MSGNCPIIMIHIKTKVLMVLISIAAVLSLVCMLYGYGSEETVRQLEVLTTEKSVKEIRTQLLLDSGHIDYRNASLTANSSFDAHIPYVNVPGINCAALFNGSIYEIIRAHISQKKQPKQLIPDNIYITAASDCVMYISKRRFTMRPLSDEEAAFPIAFSILMFRDVELFERLFRAVYRPQNFYCVHIDKKSEQSVHKAVSAIVSCFSNVFIAPQSIDVTWGTYTVLEPELICMEALLRYSKRWRYFINLTGQEFPLKTNWDIVKILKVLNGANNIEGTVERLDMARFDYLPPLPVDVRLTKGSVHIIASRAFVNFVIHNATAVAFRDWIKNSYYPDETFFSSLNHSPKLGVPGAYLGRPETDTYRNVFIARFKNWGDGPFNWICHGKRVRQVCVLGIGDLAMLADRPELFANKFFLDFEPIALDCLEQLHYNRTYAEAAGLELFDVSFYTELSYVKRHQ